MVEAAGMPGAIDPLKGVQGSSPANKAQPTEGAKSFGAYLAEQLEEVNDLQLGAADAKNKLLTGQTDDILDVVMAARKADIAFKALMEIRNKLVAAYEEVIRARG